MKLKFKIATTVLVFLYIIVSSVSASDLDLSLFKTKKVNESLYVMTQDYGDASINFAAVVGEHSVVLITTMMKEFSPHVEKLIKKVTDKPIRHVISIDGDYYQYYGSRYFVERGATFIAHKNLIPNVFENRILVDKPYRLDVGTEQLWVIPTKAHTTDHVMVKLENSNVIFAGDALSFDWIVYSGPNGPDEHIAALDLILAQGDEETIYYPGNWTAEEFGNKADMGELMAIYGLFVEKVKSLHKSGLKPTKIAESQDIHNLLKPLNDYERLSPYIIHFVKDVLGIVDES